MSLYKHYRMDKTRENEGIEVEFPQCANEDGSIPTFIVGRQARGNKKWARVLKKVYGPYQVQIDNEALSPEKEEELEMEVFIKGCVKGWKNIKDEDENPLAFNYENCKKVFEDLPDVYLELAKQSSDKQNYKYYRLEQEAKN